MVLGAAGCATAAVAAQRDDRQEQNGWTPMENLQRHEGDDVRASDSRIPSPPPTHHLVPGGVANCDLLIVGAGVSGAFAAAR